MSGIVRQFRDFFVSLKLTVWLLALSIILIFWATLTQADLGVWGVQQKFFHSFFVLQTIPGTAIPVPVYPGGYLLGGLLFINLVCAQVYRFKYTWRKTGIWLTHVGVILLLLGELLSGLLQQDNDMTLDTGETKNYSESERYNELAITDTTDPKFDQVVAIPEEVLANLQPVQQPQLPFQVVTKAYYPNATLQWRAEAPSAPPSPATQGVGPQMVAIPIPVTGKEDDRNMPLAFVELIGPEGSLGTWLVSPLLDEDHLTQHFTTKDGRTWKIDFRFQRRYLPFSITLLKFSHDIYPGTDIPRNYSSLVRLAPAGGGAGREVLIYMNNPLRTAGLTFFQHSFVPSPNGAPSEERTTVLQVVRNPSWQMPYLACALIALGLILQFCLHLAGFARKRRAAGCPLLRSRPSNHETIPALPSPGPRPAPGRLDPATARPSRPLQCRRFRPAAGARRRADQADGHARADFAAPAAAALQIVLGRRQPAELGPNGTADPGRMAPRCVFPPGNGRHLRGLPDRQARTAHADREKRREPHDPLRREMGQADGDDRRPRIRATAASPIRRSAPIWRKSTTRRNWPDRWRTPRAAPFSAPCCSSTRISSCTNASSTPCRSPAPPISSAS